MGKKKQGRNNNNNKRRLGIERKNAHSSRHAAEKKARQWRTRWIVMHVARRVRGRKQKGERGNKTNKQNQRKREGRGKPSHLAATKEQRSRGTRIASPFTCRAPGAHPGGAPNAKSRSARCAQIRSCVHSAPSTNSERFECPKRDRHHGSTFPGKQRHFRCCSSWFGSNARNTADEHTCGSRS